MHSYYHESFEARERMKSRMREAQAERLMRQARAHRRRRRKQLTWELLLGARRQATRVRLEA